MKEFLVTLTVILAVVGTAMWITPFWLKTITEWILCAAVILWFLPDVIFA